MIQQDLTALGYDTGGATGEMTTTTAVAISRFQAEHGLEVTGEASPQLAGIVKASKKGTYMPAAAPVAAPAAQDPATLHAAQQACLQEKMAATEERNKKKRGFGSLMRAVSRTATHFGNNEIAQSISQTTYDLYDADMTAKDLKSAAKDLGLTTDEVEACRNPPMPGAQS
jgi:peptidoglycan hydrolase-like protein with peptidoglycan-binding domain